MQKEFVTYELAIRLKALGFNDRVLTYFEDGNVKIYDKGTMGWDFNNSFLSCVSRPSYSQVFKWFRKTYPDIFFEVKQSSWDGVYSTFFDYKINVADKNKTIGTGGIQSYEEAELDCLYDLIEIVEQK